jgi:hypothetical protein
MYKVILHIAFLPKSKTINTIVWLEFKFVIHIVIGI